MFFPYQYENSHHITTTQEKTFFHNTSGMATYCCVDVFAMPHGATS